MDAMEMRLALALRELETLNKDLLGAWDTIDRLREEIARLKGADNDGKNDKR